MKDPQQTITELAQEMISRSHAPYSGFRVGAALWAGDEHFFGGTNVENASYGLTVCAERVAIFRWVAAGKPGEFRAMAISARDRQDRDHLARPCGACLQVIREFAADPVLYFIAGDRVEERKLSQLLPEPFSADSFSP